jgi:hypothetical protein
MHRHTMRDRFRTGPRGHYRCASARERHRRQQNYIFGCLQTWRPVRTAHTSGFLPITILRRCKCSSDSLDFSGKSANNRKYL